MEKMIYKFTILIMAFVMSYEFWFFSQHYDALDKELDMIKKVCKYNLG